MKGLLVKDFLLTTKVQGKTLGCLIVFALLMAFATDNPFFIVSYLTFICSIFSINAIIYDEMGNGYSFLFTLPVDTKNYVKSKYIFCIGITVVSVIVSNILAVAVCLFRGKEELLTEGKAVSLAIAGIVVFYQAILIPLELKFSSDKSRVLIFGVTGGLVASILVIVNLIRKNEKMADSLANGFMKFVAEVKGYQIALSVLVLCAIILCISYMISLKIMREKEF